jgi:hypothetical protein
MAFVAKGDGMKVMGIRCSNTDYSYCILSGSRDIPVVDATCQVSFPAGYSEVEILRWLHHEMQAIFKAYCCCAVGVKKVEATVKRSNAIDFRIQSEAIVGLAAAEAGCLDVRRKVKASIAKDLGLKGRGKYLETRLDTSPISKFAEYPTKVQEAILIAWSCM